MSKYRNILWIEDGDTNNRKAAPTLDYLDDEAEDNNAASVADEDLIQEFFGIKLASEVELITKYRLALERLQNNCDEYDLIVFDLDFGKDEDIHDPRSFEEILSILQEGHVKPVGENKKAEVFKSVAGYYLYLFLAMKGFPTSRMVVLTGNSENYIDQYNSESGTKYPNIFLKSGRDIIEKSHSSEWVNSFYSKEGVSHYYRIRRLINQACCYWIDRLSDENDLRKAEKIPFNYLYYMREVNGQYKALKSAITSDEFINMLEHIRMLFPVNCPSTPEKVYYQAMRTLAVYHEESARIQDIGKIKNSTQEYKSGDFANLKRFHSCIRNFRNWSSHNLMGTELEPEKFALLFCIGLRTYFSWKSENDLNDALLTYEDIYDFNRSDDSDASLFTLISSIWQETHEKLNSLLKQNSPNYYHCVYYSDLEEAVRKLGEQEGCPDMGRFMFVPIWSPKPKSGGIKQTSDPKERNMSFIVKYELTDKDCRKFFSDSHIIKISARSIFMDFCYKWLDI